MNGMLYVVDKIEYTHQARYGINTFYDQIE